MRKIAGRLAGLALVVLFVPQISKAAGDASKDNKGGSPSPAVNQKEENDRRDWEQKRDERRKKLVEEEKKEVDALQDKANDDRKDISALNADINKKETSLYAKQRGEEAPFRADLDALAKKYRADAAVIEQKLAGVGRKFAPEIKKGEDEAGIPESRRKLASLQQKFRETETRVARDEAEIHRKYKERHDKLDGERFEKDGDRR